MPVHLEDRSAAGPDCASATLGRGSAAAAVQRSAAAVAVALIAMAGTVGFAPEVTAQQPVSEFAVVEDESAARAVADLTADAPGTVTFPDDFAEVSGYLPASLDGIEVDPDGDCSSPVALPAEFDTPCKAHDLGYDLLRYADRHGEPLGPWARQAIDATFDRRIRRACDTRAEPTARARCLTMAEIAGTAVDLNSRRQHYGVPVVEDSAELPGAFGLLIGGLGLGAAGLVLTLAYHRRPARPRRLVPAFRTRTVRHRTVRTRAGATA